MKIATNDNNNQRNANYTYGTFVSGGFSKLSITSIRNNYQLGKSFIIYSGVGGAINTYEYSDSSGISCDYVVVDGNNTKGYKSDGTILTNIHYIYSQPYGTYIVKLT